MKCKELIEKLKEYKEFDIIYNRKSVIKDLICEWKEY